MPLPNFDTAAIQEMVNTALEIVTLYSDLLVILGGVILSGLAMDWFINRIRKPPE